MYTGTKSNTGAIATICGENTGSSGGLLSSRGCDKDGDDTADGSFAVHSGNNGDDTLLGAIGMDSI